MTVRTPRIHPIVRIDYLTRIPGHAGIALILWPTLTGRAHPLIVWLAIPLYCFVWPHVAYVIARRARDSRRAEHRNITLDALALGVAVPLMHFSLWPSYILTLGFTTAAASVGGLRLLGVGTGVGVGAALLAGALLGWPYEPASSAVATGASMIGGLVFMGTFALRLNQQARSLVRNRKLVEDQNTAIQAQTEALLDAKTEAEQASAAKSLFLANMSHELRTPLNAIIGYSEMLIEEAEDADDPTWVPDLQKIRTAGRHLLGLINSVLDLSKIEAGKVELNPERLDLRALLQDAAVTASPLMERNGNAFTVDCPDDLGPMEADAVKLRQVVLNLLSNAAKFTDSGRVRLAAGSAARDGEPGFEIEVEDTGIGMTEEQLGRLFEPFVQADADISARYGGTGLGLALSRRFCRLMGGDLVAESRPGEGSRFVAWLPVSAARPARPDAAVAGGTR